MQILFPHSTTIILSGLNNKFYKWILPKYQVNQSNYHNYEL